MIFNSYGAGPSQTVMLGEDRDREREREGERDE